MQNSWHWCSAQWRRVAHFLFPVQLNEAPCTIELNEAQCNSSDTWSDTTLLTAILIFAQEVEPCNVVQVLATAEQSECAIQLLWPGAPVWGGWSCAKLRQPSNVSASQSRSLTGSDGQLHGWALPRFKPLVVWYHVCPLQLVGQLNWCAPANQGSKNAPLPEKPNTNIPLAVWRRLMVASKRCSQSAWQTPSRRPPVYTGNHSFAADTLALHFPQNTTTSRSQDLLKANIRSGEYEPGKTWVSDWMCEEVEGWRTGLKDQNGARSYYYRPPCAGIRGKLLTPDEFE